MGWRGSQHRRPAEEVAQAPLSPFEPTSHERLEWRQLKAFRSGWELFCGECVIARLSTGGAFDDKLKLEFANASWQVRPRWNGHLDIVPLGGNASPARHRFGLFTGTLEREGQPDLKTRSGGFFHSWWELSTPEQQTIVRVRANNGFARVGGEVELSDAARRMADVELLTGINWAVAVCAMRQSSHAAGA